ncbi:hypothetical protein ACJRO7_004848 [Eucalyptus globulus]|uniref:BTB domain-containing protein n=1 Tax=Eucalyptus globulus TaxID=34317 RepID=A0ABD3IXW5_EUCGL
MRFAKLVDRFKSTQVHAINPHPDPAHPSASGNPAAAGGGGGGKLNGHFLKFIGSKPKPAQSATLAQSLLLAYGLPTVDLIEPPIEPCLKPINFVESLADVYRRLEKCSPSDRVALCIEQYSMLRGLGDMKLLRRCLRAAQLGAADVHAKVVLDAWLRFERRENELAGFHLMQGGDAMSECPESNLICGCGSNSICCCQYYEKMNALNNVHTLDGNESFSVEEEKEDVLFCIGDEEVHCVRSKFAALSPPFAAMLYGNFAESKEAKINFSLNGISAEGMRAVEIYSRTKRLDMFGPEIVLELLSFSNKFCCEEMKSACDAYLASLVNSLDDALILMEYGLEETSYLLVASCLQVLLSELPRSLRNPGVMKILCSPEGRERLSQAGHASFLLYYFLSLVSMEESMVSNITVMLLERLKECSTERWQKALSLHLLGCVMLDRKNYSGAEHYFEAASEYGHVYSIAGIARAKYKQGQQYLAHMMIDSLISKNMMVGWMYQERSLYGVGREKLLDAISATGLDPTLSYPYKYRALIKVEEKQIKAAVLEIDKIIGFRFLPDCLELRAWFFIALEDYGSAMRDVRALLTLEPNYKMFNAKVSGGQLVDLLSHQVQQTNQAECWMQLYERWSSVDDIGSLAVIHQMLDIEPKRGLLWFRQSLLLLRLNSQKAAMRSLRLARNNSISEQERLVYEGWILYDTGNREEALSRAEKSIAIQRSFEAFFLKAYVLADTSLDSEASSYVIRLLEEALKCPSDGLRKGQALNNLASIYVDCDKLELAATCYTNALHIKHTRAHQGLARLYHLKNQRKAAYDEMTKLIDKAHYKASAYEKRSEYRDRDMAQHDLNMATQLDPLRTYPYRYRAAVLMDDQKEVEAVEELTRAIAFKPDLQMLHLRAAFFESMGDLSSALQDCEAALCLDPKHMETLDLYHRAQGRVTEQKK